MFPESQGKGFYAELGRCLAAMSFERHVWKLCEPISWTGYPEARLEFDPVVYFKMLIIGFLENLSSERAIAARCADSLSIRAFLGYGHEEHSPSQDELSAIRQRLDPQICQEVLKLTIVALKSHGLLAGERIEPTIVEGNANLRGLIYRNTEHVFRCYFHELTKQPAVVPQSVNLSQRFVQKHFQEKAISVATEISLNERSDDEHEARWCRRLSRRRRG